MKLISIIIYVMLYIYWGKSVKSECCRSKTIAFSINCTNDAYVFNHFRMAYRCFIRESTMEYNCVMDICNDGHGLSVGTYCGKGMCNMFGCNCDGGCIGGNENPIENFKKIYGNMVHSVEEEYPLGFLDSKYSNTDLII